MKDTFTLQILQSYPEGAITYDVILEVMPYVKCASKRLKS